MHLCEYPDSCREVKQELEYFPQLDTYLMRIYMDVYVNYKFCLLYTSDAADE